MANQVSKDPSFPHTVDAGKHQTTSGIGTPPVRPVSSSSVAGGSSAATGTAAARVQDKAAELKRVAETKINEKREPAAGAMDNAASILHEKAESLPGEHMANVAHSAADKLQDTANYVRQHDVRGMASDFEQFVKRHPGQSLIAAAAVGFLIGRVFQKD